MVTVRPAGRDFSPSDAPIFVGAVLTSPLVGPDDVATARLTDVTFTPGSRTLWHRHAHEQVLIVTAGHGVIADRTQQWPLSAGDVVIVPAGEEHWHGASPSDSFTHIAVMLSAETTLLEPVDA